jgi:hypothetical protein
MNTYFPQLTVGWQQCQNGVCACATLPPLSSPSINRLLLHVD